MEEGRETENPLGLRQSTREDGLQYDAPDEADEGKRLSDSSQQFGGVKICGRPRTAVLRVQAGGECGTSKAGCQEQARIDFAQQKVPGRKRDRQKRKGAPNNRRPNLIGFESAYSQ